MSPGLRGALLAVCVAGPMIAATAWAVVVAAGERAGRAPFAAAPSRNSAEAAAAGDAAGVLRFMRLGDNPTRVYAIRPELISSSIVRVTTLEAALWSRSIDMIRTLDREGAIVDKDQRHELACLAQDLDLPEIVEYLEPGAACVPDEAMKRLAARSGPGGADDE